MRFKDSLSRALDLLRAYLPNGNTGCDEYLAVYSHLSMQLANSKPEGGSSLLVTPVDSPHVAQCCAQLCCSLAADSRKPILLVDLSEEGTRLAGLIGLSREICSSPDSRSRFFSNAGQWYMSTREGIPIGPYPTFSDVKDALAMIMASPDWSSVFEEKEWAPDDFAVPTYIKNLFFLAPAPARLALVRGEYIGDHEKNISELLKKFFERFGYVIFYGGSVLNNSLMLPIAPYVDNILLAAVENQTRTSDLTSAHSTLQAHGESRIESILIRVSQSSEENVILRMARKMAK